jgi:hypothetical protein
MSTQDYTFEHFVADSQRILRHSAGPGARETLRRNLEQLLGNEEFVSEIAGHKSAESARLLYADKEFGFRILAHLSNTAHKSPPHNHGASWAIYGQATHYTDMTEWARQDKGEGNAELTVLKQYRLSPGQAGIYQDGAIHSVESPEGARYIRITGTDLDTINRERFDLETGAIHNMRKTG